MPRQAPVSTLDIGHWMVYMFDSEGHIRKRMFEIYCGPELPHYVAVPYQKWQPHSRSLAYVILVARLM